MFWQAVGGYLLIGVLVLLSPPGRAEIAKQVRETRGNPIANAITGREEPPQWKIVTFAVIVSLGAVLLWPFALVSLLQEKRQQVAWNREWDARVAKGLEYSRMGGAGEISCEECGYHEEIVSFTHGATWGPDASCTEGRQCLECGKFYSVHRRGNPAVTPVPRCACGGELSRDHFLFCPKCRSTKLRYEMAYIT